MSPELAAYEVREKLRELIEDKPDQFALAVLRRLKRDVEEMLDYVDA